MSSLSESTSLEVVKGPHPQLLLALKNIANAPQDYAVVTQAVTSIVNILLASKDPNTDLQTAIVALSFEERDRFDTVNKQWLRALFPALASQAEEGNAESHTEGLRPEAPRLVSARNITLAAIFALLGGVLLSKSCADEPEASVSVTAE